MLHIRRCSPPDSSAGSVEMHRPKREIKMDEWRELIDLAVDLAGSDDLMDTGETGEKKRERERERK